MGAPPYRPQLEHAPLAEVVGKELHVLDGGRLPRICVLCGTRKQLVEETHLHEWQPAGGVALQLFGILGRALAGSLRRTATLTYSTCKPCIKSARDRSDLVKGLILLAIVLLLIAATLGLNWYPLVGIAIAVVTVAGGVLVLKRLLRGQIGVAYIHGNGKVHMVGVCAAAAIAAVENRRDAAGAAVEHEDEEADEDDEDGEDEDDGEDEETDEETDEDEEEEPARKRL